MGNHEFCEKCHASDFHPGRPCDPSRLARVKSEEDKRSERQKRSQKVTSGIVDRLRQMGYPAELEGGHAIVKWWNIED